MSKFDLVCLVVGILSARSKIAAVLRLSQKAGRGNNFKFETMFLVLMIIVASPEVENLLYLLHRQTSVGRSNTRA